jgi:acyl-CoA reductase-like NAD-dependent aldehyde dehydrogenase
LLNFHSLVLRKQVVSISQRSRKYYSCNYGKSPNIFFPSVAAQDDKFFSKAVEGALMFALNQGEICTTPSRILDEDIADLFIERMQARLKLVKGKST